MFRDWWRPVEGRVGRAIVALLVFSVASVSVPASADQHPATEALQIPSTGAATARPVMSLADQASRQLHRAFGSSATETRVTLADQEGRTSRSSGHWCAGGLALLAGGVAAAAVSGIRRDPNPQKPNPPVGVVLGVATAAVGGISMIRACRR